MAPSSTRQRILNAALWTLQVLLAVTLLIAAYRKLASTPESVELFEQINFGQWLRYAVGLLELALAIALVIPRLASLAALGAVVVLIGAASTEVALSTGKWLFPLVLLIMASAVGWGRRREIPVLSRLPRR